MKKYFFGALGLFALTMCQAYAQKDKEYFTCPKQIIDQKDDYLSSFIGAKWNKRANELECYYNVGFSEKLIPTVGQCRFENSLPNPVGVRNRREG